MDVAKSIQTKAELSYAMTVTDKIGGGSSGVHLYLLKKTARCNGQWRMETFRGKKKDSVIKAVNWLCANVQDDHDRVSTVHCSMRSLVVLCFHEIEHRLVE